MNVEMKNVAADPVTDYPPDLRGPPGWVGRLIGSGLKVPEGRAWPDRGRKWRKRGDGRAGQEEAEEQRAENAENFSSVLNPAQSRIGRRELVRVIHIWRSFEFGFFTGVKITK